MLPTVSGPSTPPASAPSAKPKLPPAHRSASSSTCRAPRSVSAASPAASASCARAPNSPSPPRRSWAMKPAPLPPTPHSPKMSARATACSLTTAASHCAPLQMTVPRSVLRSSPAVPSGIRRVSISPAFVSARPPCRRRIWKISAAVWPPASTTSRSPSSAMPTTSSPCANAWARSAFRSSPRSKNRKPCTTSKPSSKSPTASWWRAAISASKCRSKWCRPFRNVSSARRAATIDL